MHTIIGTVQSLQQASRFLYLRTQCQNRVVHSLLPVQIIRWWSYLSPLMVHIYWKKWWSSNDIFKNWWKFNKRKGSNVVCSWINTFSVASMRTLSYEGNYDSISKYLIKLMWKIEYDLYGGNLSSIRERPTSTTDDSCMWSNAIYSILFPFRVFNAIYIMEKVEIVYYNKCIENKY